MSNTDKNRLRVLSSEIKNRLLEYDLITPSIFSSLFFKTAKDMNINIEDEESLSNSLLDEKISIFQKLQDSSYKSSEILGKNTNNAIEAIKKKDTTSLNDILQETKNLKMELDKLKESLYEDELTKAYNRKWLFDTYISKTDESFLLDGILVMVDLNYFKIINDTFGHIIGDKVLIFIVEKFKSLTDSVIRYGGDEFIMIYPKGISIQNIKLKIEKLREDILNKSLKVKDTKFKVSFSYGIYEFEKNEKLQDILEKADEKMYQDKKTIKTRVKGIY